MTTITKRQLRTALQGADLPALSDADLARWFQVSQSAVSQWDEDQPIPRLRALEVALRRPDIFGASGSMPEAANDDGEVA